MIKLESIRGQDKTIDRLSAENKRLHNALLITAGALNVIDASTPNIKKLVKFTGQWARLGELTVDSILTIADRALKGEE